MEESRSILLPVLRWGDMSAPEGDLLLPVGTVTMLLADVQGSTRRWEADEAGMAATMAEHHAQVSELIVRHHGVRPLEQGEGDSFVAAFSRASEAIACALEIVRKAELPLRIGIHSGEAQRTDEGTYVGPTLNRTGRLRDMAYGGQIVISQAAVDLAGERLPVDAWLIDLGLHRLRDLSKPEHVFQLAHPDLRADFPALRSLDRYRHNLPPQRTPFFGRRQEIADVHALVQSSHLVTLAGPGGAGKTRLSLQVAADLVDEHADGVFFADLATVTAADDVGRVVARAIGSGEEAGADLGSYLADKDLVLVLDNCEHVIETAASLCDDLLATAPNVRVLATSREPLRIEGETTYAIPSLELPTEPVIGIEGLTPFAATELFLDRASRARADFAPTPEDAEAIAEICRRLDGIPLAIELAAARIRVLSPRQILDGLHHRFDLLTGGSRTAMPRQQTLAASVDWSHDLLTDVERAVLRRMSLFASGCTLDAAVDVCRADDVQPHQVLDILTLLVDKSLVQVDIDGPSARYRLLETIRQYALDRLVDAGELDRTQGRLIGHFVSYAETLADQQWTVRGPDAHAAFLRDRESFQLAQRCAIERGDGLAVSRLTIGIVHFLETMWVVPAMIWIEDALAFVDDLDDTMLISLLHAAAPHLFWMGPRPDLAPACARAIDHARATNDEQLIGRALFASAMLTQPPPAELVAALGEAADRAANANDTRTWFHARTHRALGLATIDPAQVEPLIEELQRELRTLDAPILVFDVGWRIENGCCLMALPRTSLEIAEHILASGIERVPDAHRHARRDLAFTMLSLGRFDEARAIAEAILPDFVAAADGSCVPILYGVIAQAASMQGEAAVAREMAAKATIPSPSNAMIQYNATIAALIELGLDDVDTADRYLELAEGPVLKMMGMVTMIDAARALVALARGDVDAVEELAHDALVAEGQIGLAATWALELVAAVAARMESHVEAVRLVAASAAHSERTGLRYCQVVIDRLRDDTLAIARRSLGDEAFDTAWVEGFAMSAVEAHAYARRGRGERKRPSSGWASLTPAERQVVDLLCEGLSNKEISGRLFTSVRTVTTHLSHIYLKLGLSSRTEVVAAAAKQ